MVDPLIKTEKDYNLRDDRDWSESDDKQEKEAEPQNAGVDRCPQATQPVPCSGPDGLRTGDES